MSIKLKDLAKLFIILGTMNAAVQAIEHDAQEDTPDNLPLISSSLFDGVRNVASLSAQCFTRILGGLSRFSPSAFFAPRSTTIRLSDISPFTNLSYYTHMLIDIHAEGLERQLHSLLCLGFKSSHLIVVVDCGNSTTFPGGFSCGFFVFGHEDNKLPFNTLCKIQNVVISGEQLTRIGKNCLKDCFYLKHLTIPNHVTIFGDNFLCNCTRIECVKLPDGLTEIGNYFLYDCSSIKELTLPKTLQKFGYGFLDGCISLGPNSVEVWDLAEFYTLLCVKNKPQANANFNANGTPKEGCIFYENLDASYVLK